MVTPGKVIIKEDGFVHNFPLPGGDNDNRRAFDQAMGGNRLAGKDAAAFAW